MIDRPTLKENAKFAFKRNYWPCVGVALIIGLLTGGGNSAGSGFNYVNRTNTNTTSHTYQMPGNSYGDDDLDDILEDYNITTEDSNHGDNGSPISREDARKLLGTFSVAIGIVVLVIALVAIAFSIFIVYPLSAGCCRYFVINSFEKPNFNEVGFAFKKGTYKNVVFVIFMKNLFIFLWSLLFIIPGIIFTYKYYLVDYIISEDPTLDYKDALEKSDQMMKGYKWDTFVLELSFIGWYILSIFTCGLLSIFYVNPYYHATKAELFLSLRNKYFGPDVAPYYTPSFAGGYGNQQFGNQFNGQQQYGNQFGGQQQYGNQFGGQQQYGNQFGGSDQHDVS